MKTYQKVYKLVKKIPKGKVTTYGQIGQMLDLDPRVVGWALNKLAAHGRMDVRAYERKKERHRSTGAQRHKIPWHRVISSKGIISTNRVMNIPLGLQKRLLEKEGIRFNQNEKINLKKYLFPDIIQQRLNLI